MRSFEGLNTFPFWGFLSFKGFFIQRFPTFMNTWEKFESFRAKFRFSEILIYEKDWMICSIILEEITRNQADWDLSTTSIEVFLEALCKRGVIHKLIFSTKSAVFLNLSFHDRKIFPWPIVPWLWLFTCLHLSSSCKFG